MTADFSLGTVEGIIQLNDIFKVLKETKVTIDSYSVKLFIRNENEIKTFSSK